MEIRDLGDHPAWLPTLARWHYDQWGPLTGAGSFDDYVARLVEATASRTLPSVFIAVADGALLGSATLVAADLPPRLELTPWLAQLFVEPTRRRDGVGAALVHAVLQRARQCHCPCVYLYTSGTLPRYYEGLGWRVIETLSYRERERTVMRYDLRSSAAPGTGMRSIEPNQ
jgi:predicted N-acetyltransferase YhbS